MQLRARQGECMGRHTQSIKRVVMIAACMAGGAEARAKDDLTYLVKRGDTLYGLSAAYAKGAKAVRHIQQANHIRLPRRLPTGKTISVPRDLLRFDPIPLRIVNFSGPVSVSINGSDVSVIKGLTLPEGALIRTVGNGFVSLVGSDGSRIILPSQTRVRVARARRYRLTGSSDIDFAIEQGRAEIRAAKQQAQGRLRTITPGVVSAVRGTIFRAGYNQDANRSVTEVIEGTVETSSQDVTLAIGAGSGVFASPEGTLSQATLLPAPKLQSVGKVQTESVVHFDFTPVPHAGAYLTQVARDASFLDIVAESENVQPVGEFPDIKNGTYFVRSIAVDTNSLHGVDEVWSFRRQRVGLSADVSPTALPGGFRVNWMVEGEGTSIFRFQLYSQGNGDVPAVDESGLLQPGITLTNLKRGLYRWRVGVTQTTSEGSTEVWTSLQQFTVSN